MICMMCGDPMPTMHHICYCQGRPTAIVDGYVKLPSQKKLDLIPVEQKDNKVAIVFGTYNRLHCLKLAINSIIKVKENTDIELYIVDGGSTDGTKEWIRTIEIPCNLIEQKELTGATKAFNLGFKKAVEDGHQWICHHNDDAEFVTSGMFETAISMMLANPKIGEVAFEFDLIGQWAFYQYAGVTYANYGLIRREAGIEVAVSQGDKNGFDWWNPIYRTYAADAEFGFWLWKNKWIVEEGTGLRVHDNHNNDEMRRLNTSTQAREIKLLTDRLSIFR